MLSVKLYAPDISSQWRIVFEISSLNIICHAYTYKYEVLQTIIKIESGEGDSKLVNIKEDAVGILQLRKIYVNEVNRISNKKFSYKDRFDENKSIEMFFILNDRYNPSYNIDTVAHCHNAGVYNIHKRWKYTKTYRKRANQIYKTLKL